MTEKLAFAPIQNLKGKNSVYIRDYIIDRFNTVEHHLKELVIEYFGIKENKKIFRSILMNSNVISYAGKVKVIAGANILNIKTCEKLNELGSIRNAFAHTLFTLYTTGNSKKIIHLIHLRLSLR